VRLAVAPPVTLGKGPVALNPPGFSGDGRRAYRFSQYDEGRPYPYARTSRGPPPHDAPEDSGRTRDRPAAPRGRRAGESRSGDPLAGARPGAGRGARRRDEEDP